MGAIRTWTLKIRGDENDALRAADKVEKRFKGLDIDKGLKGSMGRLQSRFSSFSSGMVSAGQKLARGLTLAAGAGIAGFLVLAGKATDAASDLNESINAIEKTFGPAVDKIKSFGRVSAEQVGLSRRAFNELATPVGAMLRNAGLGVDETAQATINLTKRAADMASVFNTDVKDSMTAIQAALRGESDPIERYGVNMSAAAVEAEAMAMGVKKSWNEMSTQEKAAARLSLLFKQTSRVAGDFADTSNQVANAERIARAKGEELAAMFGQKLLPIKAKAIGLALDLMRNLGDLGGAFKAAFSGEGITSNGLTGFMERLGVVARAVWPTLQRIGRAVADFGLRVRDFFKANPKVLFATLAAVIGTLLVGALLALGAAALAAISPFALLVVAVGAIAGAVTYAYTRWSWFRDAVDEVVQWFKQSALPRLEAFGRTVRDAFEKVVSWAVANWPKVKRAVASVVDWVVANWPKVERAVGAVIDWFKTTAWPALQRFADQVREKFQGFVTWVKSTWPQVSEAIGHVLKAVGVIIGVFVVAALFLWRTFGDTILTFARNIWDAIWRVIEGALQVIRGIIQTVLAVINGDWGKAWEGIQLVLSGAWGIIRGLVEGGLAAVLGVVGLGLDAIQGVWNLVWEGMSAAMGGIWRGIKNGVTTGVNAVIGVINWFIRLINHIPGVDIDEIGKVGGGGGKPEVRTGAQEHGNRRASGGFMTNGGGKGAEYVVGEGNRFRPEAVIATDPKYRRRNLGLWAWAGSKLGVPGFQKGGVPGFAMGGIPNPIDAAKDAAGAVADWGREQSVKALGPLRDQAKNMIGSLPGGDTTKFVRDFGKGVIDRMYNWARGKTEEHERATAGANAGYSGGGAERWRSVALTALAMAGQPASWIGSLLRRMNQESGGNPRAINLWDSNAAAGIPSKGLMQTIQPTFDAYAGMLRPRGVWDPLANIYAAIRYTVARYGSGPAGWDRKGGYRGGLRRVAEDGQYRLHEGERVLTKREANDYDRPGGGRAGTVVHIGQLVIQANDGPGGRRAAKAFTQTLEERKILTDARIA